MAALRFNDNEQAALLGLPHAAIALYLWLRARMDFSTGMVGVRPMVSWFALAQDLYVEPAPGRSRSGRPHVESVRRLAGVLERRGLVKTRSVERPPQLIFKLVLADTLLLARKQPDRNPTPEPDREPAGLSRGRSADRSSKADRQARAEADTHPVSGSKHRAAAGRGGNGYSAPAAAEVVFPQESTPGERRAFLAIARRLELTREELQLLLDELAGKIRRQSVRNKPALLEVMAGQLRRGEFYGLFAERERGGGAPLSIAEIPELEKLQGGR